MGFPTMGQYHNFIEYNPVHKLVIFGGGNGSSDVYRIDGAGKITKMRNAPIALGILKTIVAVDPVSGKYLVFTDDDRFYEYDVTSDTWARQQRSFPSLHISDGIQTVEAGITNYGVNMFVKYDYTQATVWLYKHTGGGVQSPPGDVLAPDAPSNLRVQ